MTAVRDVIRIAALEVKVAALIAQVDALRDRLNKAEAEKQERALKGKAA